MIVDKGQVVAQWGDVTKRVKLSSMRKSLVSALYGIYVQEGRVDLSKTLEQLNIEAPRVFRRLQLLRVIHRVLPDPEG
ncbi:hypothetical protein [Paraburkholderia aspalathi]|uniref:hypothetical protein n=1 Tax=Paraburkholderia aspalathi TaxID=1324617 RepID=UPI0038B9AF62